MNKIFVKASAEFAETCNKKAYTWWLEINQVEFKENNARIRGAIAEYIANEKGFTLFDSNAKYPKSKNL